MGLSRVTQSFVARIMAFRRMKLFSQGVTTPIQSLENDINEFLES
jgi:hypothetical protein